jgi:hypothetical protein
MIYRTVICREIFAVQKGDPYLKKHIVDVSRQIYLDIREEKQMQLTINGRKWYENVQKIKMFMV